MADHGDHQQPASAAGIVYQLERALLRLAVASSAEGVVGVETDDDVATETLLEQDKFSTQATGHPFQDRSVALWKTVANWVVAANTGSEHLRTAELHLVTNRPVPAGALARMLGREKKTDAFVKECKQKLVEIGKKPADTIKKHVLVVLSNKNRVNLDSVIRRMRMSDAACGTGSVEMRERIIGELHLPPEVDSEKVVHGLQGWLQATLQGLWLTRAPGWITREQLDRQLHAILDEMKRARIYERAASLLPVSPEERSEAHGRQFVERLVEIDVTSDELDRAIDAFIRHKAENFRLAQTGDFTEADWVAFYDELLDRWAGILQRVARLSSAETVAEEEQGRRLLTETTDTDWRGPLQGRPTTHGYFTRGGYHRLADESRVWWHPSPGSQLQGGT